VYCQAIGRDPVTGIEVDPSSNLTEQLCVANNNIGHWKYKSYKVIDGDDTLITVSFNYMLTFGWRISWKLNTGQKISKELAPKLTIEVTWEDEQGQIAKTVVTHDFAETLGAAWILAPSLLFFAAPLMLVTSLLLW
jgi:hypothetical protein